MKTNILSRLLFIPLLAILFTGCDKWFENEVLPIPANLYPSYELGDTLMYKSIVTDDIDSFLLVNFIMDTIYDGSMWIERTSALFEEIVGDTLAENFFIVANEPSRGIYWGDSIVAYFTNISATLDTSIQGFDYTGLMVEQQYRADTLAKNLHKIYFDWKYGMVKYVDNSLDSYELFYR